MHPDRRRPGAAVKRDGQRSPAGIFHVFAGIGDEEDGGLGLAFFILHHHAAGRRRIGDRLAVDHDRVFGFDDFVFEFGLGRGRRRFGRPRCFCFFWHICPTIYCFSALELLFRMLLIYGLRLWRGVAAGFFVPSGRGFVLPALACGGAVTADVAAVLRAVERDLLDAAVGALCRLLDGRSECRHGEHAAACRQQPLLLAPGAGQVDDAAGVGGALNPRDVVARSGIRSG